MKPQALHLLVLCVATAATPAMAQTAAWCYQGRDANGNPAPTHPDVIFCDDFDRYCHYSPYPPYVCAEGTWSIGDFRELGWARELCGTELWGQGADQGDWYESYPFSVRYECQTPAELGQSTTDLRDDIHNRWGAAVSYAAATDANPLHFEFTLFGQSLDEKIRASNVYFEICTAADLAPTYYVKSPPCETVPIGSDYADGWPIIAQQGPIVPPGAPNPDVSPMPVHASIAVGALAFLDHDPCSRTFDAPYNDRLCVFDGKRWWQLRAGLFGAGNGAGEFYLYRGVHHIKLTIWATSIKVEMWARTPEPDEYSWCILPREYAGGFNTMRGGFAMSCRIGPSSWSQCLDKYRCIRGNYPYAMPMFDNLVLYGGEPQISPAITQHPQAQEVLPGGTAIFTVAASGTSPLSYQWQKNSVNLSNAGHYSGVTTPTLTVSDVNSNDVANYRCNVTSPYGSAFSSYAALSLAPWRGDFDHDGDVDLSDFGGFQYCFNGPNRPLRTPDCTVADLDRDGDADLADFAIFQICFNGPNRPPACR